MTMAKTKTIEEILQTNPIELIDWLQAEFELEVPHKLETIEELKNASKLLSKTTNTYSYLMNVSSYAKIYVREKKRISDKATKESKAHKDDEELAKEAAKAKLEYENMIDRKEAIDNAADIANKQYNAISRMIAVKREINTELQMLSTEV